MVEVWQNNKQLKAGSYNWKCQATLIKAEGTTDYGTTTLSTTLLSLVYLIIFAAKVSFPQDSL